MRSIHALCAEFPERLPEIANGFDIERTLCFAVGQHPEREWIAVGKRRQLVEHAR